MAAASLAGMLTAHGIRIEFAPRRGAMDEFRFWGTAWRGALGHALRREACPLDDARADCARCALAVGCIHARLFPEQTKPRDRHGMVAPHSLFAEAREGRMRVDCILFGRESAGWRRTVERALVRAGARGVGGVRFEPARIESMAPSADEVFEGPVRVRMRSPMRFKHRGRYVGPERMAPELWFAALKRRILALGQAIGEREAARRLVGGVGEPRCGEACWRWKELSRYSRRQRKTMGIGGVLGSFVVEADRAVADLLAVGRFTHVGKLASMGLGRYELEVIEG